MLNQLRATVLTNVGMGVVASEPEPAMKLLRQQPWKVVLLCHTMGDSIRRKLQATVKAQDPSTCVLLLLPNYPLHAFPEADDVIDTTAGPDVLVKTISEALRRDCSAA